MKRLKVRQEGETILESQGMALISLVSKAVWETVVLRANGKPKGGNPEAAFSPVRTEFAAFDRLVPRTMAEDVCVLRRIR